MRKDIEKIIKDNKISTFGYKGSIKRLEQLLSLDEKVLYIMSGNVTFDPGEKMEVDILSIKDKEPAVLAITDKRIILIFKVLMSEKIDQFPIKEIREHRIVRNGLTGGKLRISTLTRKFDIDLNYKKETADTIDKILLELEKGDLLKDTEVHSGGEPHEDIIIQIERLAKLRDSGILSKDEFDSKKSELLKRL